LQPLAPFFARRLILVAILSAVPGRGSAQLILGPGDDAWTLPRGVLRVSIAPRFLSATERFGMNGREAIGAPFAGPLDASRLPTLRTLADDISALAGTPSFEPTLGNARINGGITSALIPLSLQAGLFDRVTLRASVPFFTGEQEAEWLIDGTDATLGANPAVSNGAALTTNTGIVARLEDAAANLEALANDCATNPDADPRCGQIAAELSQVRSLVDRARATTALLARIYGGSVDVSPALFVPRTGSATHASVLARIEALRADFDRYGTTSVEPGEGPVGAGTPPTRTELDALLADSAYGYALGAVRRRYRQGIGDIDVGITLRVFDAIARDPWRADTASRRGIRQSVGLTYRLGTGEPANGDEPMRLPTGDGQDDIELVSATDVVMARSVWASVVIRWTIQRPLDQLTRIPDETGSPFIPLERRRMSRTTLGNRLAVSASPRWVLNDRFAAGLEYRFMNNAAGSIEELAPLTDGIPLIFDVPSFSAHEVGIGITWSSVAAWRRGRARWPVDVEWQHSRVVAGSAGVIRFSANRISVRAYVPLWGN
jgi:hypothetical protein